MKKTPDQLKKAWNDALDEHNNWFKVYFLLLQVMAESGKKVESTAKAYFEATKKKVKK